MSVVIVIISTSVIWFFVNYISRQLMCLLDDMKKFYNQIQIMQTKIYNLEKVTVEMSDCIKTLAKRTIKVDASQDVFYINQEVDKPIDIFSENGISSVKSFKILAIKDKI